MKMQRKEYVQKPFILFCAIMSSLLPFIRVYVAVILLYFIRLLFNKILPNSTVNNFYVLQIRLFCFRIVSIPGDSLFLFCFRW